jgi:hypothetical protein
MTFSHWATDKTFEVSKWDWEEDTKPFCLQPKYPADEIGKLTDKELEISKIMVDEWAKL